MRRSVAQIRHSHKGEVKSMEHNSDHLEKAHTQHDETESGYKKDHSRREFLGRVGGMAAIGMAAGGNCVGTLLRSKAGEGQAAEKGSEEETNPLGCNQKKRKATTNQQK